MTYHTRRSQLTEYFDRTAVKAWEQLTSDEPLSGIRATVRAGRDEMRNLILQRLPDDLRGMRVLDAGCGTGAFAVAAAQRGAQVTAIDVAQKLIEVAKTRTPQDLAGDIDYRVGDMNDAAYGEFDYIVAMDSLIHYQRDDVIAVLREFAQRCRHSIQFTFAPRTAALAAMHFVGRMVPHRHHRAPSIVPIEEADLHKSLDDEMNDKGWRVADSRRVKSGFYISQTVEMCPQ